jgi:PLP dependent protein
MSAEGEVDMKINPARAKALSSALSSVTQRIEAVAGGRNVSRSFFVT